ncbi:serine hydrolase domain-containing protein [Actinoplanes sp. NPDC051851]|uniref:serine hydrolase domain-containing protein n=1 Tax=Actinoplanes sp. NPDC051851 TaxID=3154753 RepID=UPI0034315896
MRANLGRWTLATTLVAVLVAGSALPAAAAAASRPNRLQSAADDLHRLGITGVQTLSRTPHGQDAARAGVADLEKQTPVPADGYFRMGSNTKTFVAVVTLQLAGEGRLSLDDTVEHWLPGVVTGNGNDGGRITVRNLLQHTSGLYNYTRDIDVLGTADGYLAHRYDHYDPAGLIAIAVKHEPGFEPGTHWDYSNTNYVLAGMIIERATGHSWGSEVRSRILRPLGLRHTVVPGDRATVPDPHAEGYQQWEPGAGLVDTTILNPSVADAAGSLITTPSDLATFWQALQQGRLLKPAQMTQMHQTVLAETMQDYYPGIRYGLGIMWTPSDCGGFWLHPGDVPGTSTWNAVSTNGSRVAIVSLTTQLADPTTSAAVETRTGELLNDVICHS